MPLTREEMSSALAHLERGDWQAAHAIVQCDEEDDRACWMHGIVHLMEGDEANARYWYRRAKRPLPAERSVDAELRALKAVLG